jgi:hypothetical protein
MRAVHISFEIYPPIASSVWVVPHNQLLSEDMAVGVSVCAQLLVLPVLVLLRLPSWVLLTSVWLKAGPDPSQTRPVRLIPLLLSNHHVAHRSTSPFGLNISSVLFACLLDRV